jgi:hypothetical protein
VQRLVAVAGLVWLCGRASALPMITFDTDTAGNSILTGTQISTLFSSWGVLFSTVATGGYGQPGVYEGDSVLGGGYVGNTGHAEHYVTPPNVLAYRTSLGRVWRVFRDDWAYGVAEFSGGDVGEVSVVASISLPSVAQNAYVRAWLDDGTALTRTIQDGLARETLSLSAPTGRSITSLEFHGQGFEGTGTGVYYDNLTLVTPEPGTAWLLLLGLGALAAARRGKAGGLMGGPADGGDR